MRSYSPDSPWRLDPSITYLTHGTFGAAPVPVLDAQRELQDALEANAIRFLDRELPGRLDAARAVLGAFLNADPEGLVSVANATTGVSTVLRSLPLRPGDELITTDHEYNATLNALAQAADEHRARVVRVHVPLPIRHAGEVTEAILGAVTQRTRLALVSHVTSPTGLVFPIEDIVRELDRLGVDTLVDAAHAPGMVPVDLDTLAAAYWTGNGHKWLCGPKVSGMLVVREDRRQVVRPLVTSHGANDQRLDRPRLWKLFDWPGTFDPTTFLVLPESIRVLGGLRPDGWPGLMAENREKAVNARRRLLEAIGSERLAPESMLGSMAAVSLPGEWTDDSILALTNELAEADRIEVAINPWPVRAARETPASQPSMALLRVSAQRYVEDADIDRLIDALERRGIASSAARDTVAAGSAGTS